MSRGAVGKLLLWVAAQLATEAYDEAKRLGRSLPPRRREDASGSLAALPSTATGRRLFSLHP